MTIDLELVRRARFSPEEPTQAETEAILKLESLDYSIYTRKLELACKEAKEILKKLGISAFIKAGDTANAIYTSNGDMSIAEVGTYMHVVTGILPIKYVLKHYVNEGTVGVKDGDIFFCNEAIYGGIHNPDMITFMPVFAGGQLIAWVTSASHEPETGATEPGGMPISARSRYDEGLKVPPIRIGENFMLKKDLVELFENNVRYPLMITNDHMARVVACQRMRNRILEIVEQRGREFVLGILRKIIIDTSEAVKARIRKIPNGTFRQVAFLDTVGRDQGLLRLPVTLVKEGDKISLDMTHASPQVPGPYNTFEHVVLAHLTCNVFQYMLNDMPASAGCLTPFEVRTTPGSCLNASADAAISNVSYILPSLINAVQILLIKLLYSIPEYRKDEYIALPTSNVIGGFVVSGNNQWGRHVTTTLLAISNSRAGGARPDKDGVESLGFWFAGYAEAVDCEQDESMFPLVTVWRDYRPDGGGPGKYRGGTGLSFGYMVRNTDEISLMPTGAGHRFPLALGVFAGYPAPSRVSVIVEQAMEGLESEKAVPRNEIELLQKYSKKLNITILPTSSPAMKLREGDLFAKTSGGAGGYGDVLEREPDAVMKDVALGKVSHWAARNVYHVQYDASTLAPDGEATAAERDGERKRRLKLGRPYSEFVNDWEKKRPRQDILRFYGDWPTPFP